MILFLSSLFFVAVIAAPLALPRPQESEPPRCRTQLNYLLCLETCVLPGTVECPDRCCKYSDVSLSWFSELNIYDSCNCLHRSHRTLDGDKYGFTDTEDGILR